MPRARRRRDWAPWRAGLHMARADPERAATGEAKVGRSRRDGSVQEGGTPGAERDAGERRRRCSRLCLFETKVCRFAAMKTTTSRPPKVARDSVPSSERLVLVNGPTPASSRRLGSATGLWRGGVLRAAPHLRQMHVLAAAHCRVTRYITRPFLIWHPPGPSWFPKKTHWDTTLFECSMRSDRR